MARREYLNGQPVSRANPFAPWSEDDLDPDIWFWDARLAGYNELPDEPEVDEWLVDVATHRLPLLFLIERCCHEGELLPLELRESRLSTFPLDARIECERAIHRAPRDYAEALFRMIALAVGIERARRQDEARRKAFEKSLGL